MSNDLYSVDFTRALPPSLKTDPTLSALADVIAGELQNTAHLIKQNIVYPRIDELDEKLLDILAYDLHIDWYDHSYTVDVKRAVIKNSVKVHRKLGTKYAVETALNDVFPGSNVEEWFEYGGEPYWFRVNIALPETGITPVQQEGLISRVQFYKNLRSWVDEIRYQMPVVESGVHVSAAMGRGMMVTSLPELVPEYNFAARVHSGGAMMGGIMSTKLPELSA